MSYMLTLNINGRHYVIRFLKKCIQSEISLVTIIWVVFSVELKNVCTQETRQRMLLSFGSDSM
jgi:hypothetical protein